MTEKLTAVRTGLPFETARDHADRHATEAGHRLEVTFEADPATWTDPTVPPTYQCAQCGAPVRL